MIGDYVTFQDCQYDDAPVIIKINEISADGGAFAFIDGDDALDGIAIDEEIVGIPITTEILEKSGFGYTEQDEYFLHFYPGTPRFCAHMNFHIGTNNKGHYWLNYEENDIFGLHYVHQLQHALKLCGAPTQITI